MTPKLGNADSQIRNKVQCGQIFFFFKKVNAKLTFWHFISPLGVVVLITNMFSTCYQVCLMVLGETH